MNIKKCIPYLILIFIFSTIASFFAVLAPLIVGDLIDILFILDTSSFLTEIAKLFKIYLIIFLSNFLQLEILISFASNICKKLRQLIFNKIHTLPMNSLNSISYGEILNNFSVDIENVFSAISQALPKILGGLITVFVSLYYMFNLNITITCVLIFIAPLIYFLSRFITKKTNKLFKERASILDNLNSFSEELIKNSKTIQNFGYYDTLSNKFTALNNKFYKVSKNAQFFSSLANPSTRLVSNISYCFVGILGIYLVSLNNISIGNVASFLLYSNIFTRPFNEFTSVLTEIQTGITSFSRIKKFIDMPEYTVTSSILPLPNDTKFKGEIEFRNVCFSYNKNHKILENISFHILPGEHFAIVGKTGCGKTTLVNLLMRFYEIDSGEILIDGINIKNIDKTLLRKNIGMVLQDTKLFTDTIKNNISYGSINAKDFDILEASKLAHSDNFIQNLPHKYSTYLSSSEALSSGETQLITIARMFLYNPSILILDEATSNVDLITEQAIQKSLKKLITSSTSLTIAHRLSTIVNSDTILFMENGKIVEQGSHKDLLKAKGKYFDLYNSQFI